LLSSPLAFIASITASLTALRQTGKPGLDSTIIGTLLPALDIREPTYFLDPCGLGSKPKTVKLKLFLAIIIKDNHTPAENPHHTIYG
jgi:hypothetical protein